MRILFIITRADTIGGAQVHVRDLAIHLQKNHHQVLILTGSGGPYTENLAQNKVKHLCCSTFIRNLNPIKDWQTFNFITNTIKNFQPDLISTHSSKAGILGRLAAKLTGTPCIFTAHGWAFTEGVPQPQRIIYQNIEKLTENLATQIVCVSNHDRQIGLKIGMSEDRLLTIHNGMPNISEQLKANPSKNDPVKIVMIARFEQQKDHLTLIKALQNIEGVQLDLVGEGSNIESIKNLVQDLGLSERVRFRGHCFNVAEILSEAQIFVLISNWEGFPRTTIEAMRAGLPVIVSDVGGASEAILEGITGYCVPQGDIVTLRKQLCELVANDQLRQKMGEQARTRYEEEFTFDQMFAKTFNLYQKILAKRKIYHETN